MADGKLTIQKFINGFKKSRDDKPLKTVTSISDLEGINLKTDFFIKDMDDKDFMPDLMKSLKGPKNGFAYHEDKADVLQFFTWIEIGEKHGNGEYSDSSFWLFPVVFYKDNDSADLINSALSLIRFRNKISTYLPGLNRKLKVGVLGDYSKEFDGLGSGADKRALSIMRRQAEILKDNIENEFDDVKVCLINHQYENLLKNYYFTGNDINDVEKFIEVLTKDSQPFKDIKNKLSEKTKTLIDDTSNRDLFVENLIKDFNTKLLKDEGLRTLIPEGGDNRSRLEEAFKYTKDEKDVYILDKYQPVDILIVPNGFMGNALYRAWVSMGYMETAVSLVFHEKTSLPMWLGQSTYDANKATGDTTSNGNNDIITGFALACQGLKDRMSDDVK